MPDSIVALFGDQRFHLGDAGGQVKLPVGLQRIVKDRRPVGVA
jgi:hypothetical protein